MDLALIFMVLMGVSVLAYVVLDGYDLGVGMLMPAASAAEQSVMVSSIGPFWDANETWLVLAWASCWSPSAGARRGAGRALPAGGGDAGGPDVPRRGLRVPHEGAGLARELWNWLFWAGSFLASFSQGFMLGRYITGFRAGRGFPPFRDDRGRGRLRRVRAARRDLACAQDEGELQRKALAWSRWGLLWVALGVGLVSLATPMVSETVRAKWFDFRARWRSWRCRPPASGRVPSSGARRAASRGAKPPATGCRSPRRRRSSRSASWGSPTASSRTS